jgi:hypothetical protein
MWLLCSFQGPPRGAPGGIRRMRSLKTQQHARARAPRDAAPSNEVLGGLSSLDESRLARPGSVDVLGRTVGGRWLRFHRARPRARKAMAGHGAVLYGSPEGTP